MLNYFITALFWLATFILLVGLWRRAQLWRNGQAAEWKLTQLFTIPKRYFVDLHHVVAREPYIARTHVATAGGAVAAIALVAINYGLMLYSTMLNWAIVIATCIMFIGAFFVWLRRTSLITNQPPSRLSKGNWSRLPYSLLAFSLGLLLLTLPITTLSNSIAVIAALLLLAGSAELALGIGMGGPMKHAIAGLLHLAFHPRQERFNDQLSTALKPLNLQEKEFGINKPSDFNWNQLLGFDACVQCGKCEAACPAFAAGQPLNPKKLIQDLVVGLSSGTDASFAGSPYAGIPVGTHAGSPNQAIVPALIEAQTLWACTTCRACVQECPMLIEHVDAIVGMRRNLTLTQGSAPNKAPQLLENLRQTANQNGEDNLARYYWAIDLDVKTISPITPVDVLLVAGEGAFDMRYQRTLRALVKLLKAAKVDFAVMGALENDTGDTARRLGDEATFQMLAKRNIANFNTLKFKRILTADPHVLHCLKNEYPAFGGHYEVLHHSTFLAQLVANGALKLSKSTETRKLTYHDPCYLARYNNETKSPRALLKSIGLRVNEMERSGLRGRCCGGGGGAPLTDIAGKQRIPDIRIADARSIGAEVVAVACPQCTAMLEGVIERPEVLDIAELLAASLVVASSAVTGLVIESTVVAA
ncbi:MAG: (Fe-S)-binding protein [Bdellovibrio sp.]|nr:(Fe-S)-binding protein [Methylotenera sp.]